METMGAFGLKTLAFVKEHVGLKKDTGKEKPYSPLTTLLVAVLRGNADATLGTCFATSLPLKLFNSFYLMTLVVLLWLLM